MTVGQLRQQWRTYPMAVEEIEPAEDEPEEAEPRVLVAALQSVLCLVLGALALAALFLLGWLSLPSGGTP